MAPNLPPDWQSRVTPERVTALAPGQVFVFGSNFRGIHGAGAALTARKLFGAQPGVGEGRTGQCYALPTKLNPKVYFDLPDVASKVIRFTNQIVEFNTYLVTAVGCGLAGFTPKQIAPLFRRASELPNIWLPRSFWDVLATL